MKQANFELKNFKDAKEDFEKVLELDPNSKDAKRQVGLCDKNIKLSLNDEILLAKNMMSMIGKGPVSKYFFYKKILLGSTKLFFFCVCVLFFFQL